MKYVTEMERIEKETKVKGEKNNMAANVETMFSVREKPWHGLGVVVEEAPSSEEALRLAGLDWRVVQKSLYTNSGLVDGYKANVRESDNTVLGVVTDRYKVVQNTEAFAFTDNLLGEGVKYETAGSLQGGKKVWILARLPREYIMSGERITPYLVFSNTHDGSGAVKVAITPVRVVCNNTLNLALSTANRCFSMVHTGDIKGKIDEAKQTLFMADEYMEALGNEFERMRRQRITDQQVKEYIEMLLPIDQDSSSVTARNIRKLRDDMRMRYYDAPDLTHLGNNAYRFINAVSDFATHANPIRRSKNYNENLFMRTYEGNPMIDKAYQLLAA